MPSKELNPQDESLDPEDWEAMRNLGHMLVDDMLQYLKTRESEPVWQHAPAEVKAHFDSSAPKEPQSVTAIYEEFNNYVLPYLLGNNHPRFWGWIAGTGTVMGAYADFLASAVNSPSGSFSFVSANYVENQLLNWFKEMLNFPMEASGLLTSGGSASNLIGLAVARNSKAGYDIRQDGISASQQRMVLYASTEAHSSLQKSIELLGLGSRALRKVPVNEAMEISIPHLREAIDRDRDAGHLPVCIVGAAGTTNTGAIDDLHELANISEEQNIWFHIDGAFGAWAAIAPESHHLVAGMERADSLAFDLHKWMYIPYDIGCVLVRSEEDHRQAFSLTPTYLAHGSGERGLTANDVPWKPDYGFQLSRAFPALKAWMSIKESGVRKFGRMIQKNIDQAHYLGKLVESDTELELALPVSMNVTCFRFKPAGMTGSQLDGLNKNIEIELHEQGIAVPSIVNVHGNNFLHVAITNHRSRMEDFDILVDAVKRIGNELIR